MTEDFDTILNRINNEEIKANFFERLTDAPVKLLVNKLFQVLSWEMPKIINDHPTTNRNFFSSGRLLLKRDLVISTLKSKDLAISSKE